MAKDAKSAFCEDSRVKFPTLMHLMGIGFKYVSLKGLKTKYVEAPKTEFDPLTNILTDYFTDAYCTLNPKAEKKDAEDMLGKIQKSLQNDDLGRQFYNEILLNTGERIIDLSSPANFYRNNTFQVTTEMTCGSKDSDNYRPDITIFVNGLPLAFIEVKKENNHKGIQAETDRMKQRFVNPQYHRFLNITQIMVFSNDMEYDNNEVTPTIGAFYATIGKKNTKCYCFREEFSYRGLTVTSVQNKGAFANIISCGLTLKTERGKPWITVVNIQKFSNDSKALAKNANNVTVQRIYFIDDAHRNYSPDGSFLKNLISSDTNAVKIALTGTPIISKEYNTKDIFGDYIQPISIMRPLLTVIHAD